MNSLLKLFIGLLVSSWVFADSFRAMKNLNRQNTCVNSSRSWCANHQGTQKACKTPPQEWCRNKWPT